VDAQCVDPAKLESYDAMVRVRKSSEAELNLLESTKESIASLKQAKAQSQAMMEKLSRETFEITDVRDSSRTDEVNRLLLQSRQDYERARQGSSMSLVDWLIINQMLSNSRSQMQQAVYWSQAAPSPSFSSLDDDSSTSRRSSSSDWFGDSSSSSSSGGFFGGGDSGGGGGGGGSFSSGSGSDGTY
ncbi:MAG TPA: hypothetical protein VNB54_14050, partial [Alphaproteobacteria bacterium]|nr:hypothetical protein [Alphaproteobacteria bacterium]